MKFKKERKKEIPKYGRSGSESAAGGYPYSAELFISNISYHDVETYKCHYANDENEYDNVNENHGQGLLGSERNCKSNNIKCVHLFVDGKS